MISVCIATYNGEKYIEKQIKSILCQLHLEDELIISDDKSNDSTIKIIEKIADSRIKILPIKKFGSAIRNFENAILHAKGDIIFLSDQDDIWLPEKVTKMVNALSEADLVLSDCIVIDNKNNILHKSFFEFRHSKPGLWRAVWKNPYMGCCIAFRRTMLVYSLPFPNNIHMHDWWIGLIAEYYGKVVFLYEPLIKYVRHGSNVSPTAEGRYSWMMRIKNRFWMLWYLIKRIIR